MALELKNLYRIQPARVAAAVLLLLPGLALLAAVMPVLWQLVCGPRDLYSLGADELDGTYAAAEIDTIWDWYADSVTPAADGSERTVAREYLVPLADGKTFIGVEVPADQIPVADKVLEQTDLWRSDPDSYIWDGTKLTVRGSIRPMDGQTAELYYGFLAEYYGVTSADLDRFPPLVLVQGKLDGMSGVTVTVLGVAAIVFLAAAAVQFSRALRGPDLEQIFRYCAAQPDEKAALDQVDRLGGYGRPFCGLSTGAGWLLHTGRNRDWALRLEDVAWVYIARPAGRSGWRVMVCSRSEAAARSRHGVPVRHAAEARQVVDWLRLRLPDAVFGYSPAREQAYRCDPMGFGHPAVVPDPPEDPILFS